MPSKSIPFGVKLALFGVLAIAADLAIIFSTRGPSTPTPGADSAIGTVLLVVGGLFFYFIPSIAAWHKRNFGAILILNFLLGWTVIGWIVALVWGWTNDRPEAKA